MGEKEGQQEKTPKKKSRSRLSDARLAFWRKKGLISEPKSEAQGLLALAARDFVHGLKCRQEVERLLALGRSSKDLAYMIREQWGEGKEKKFPTVRRYLQCFLQFWIPPIEVMRAQASAVIQVGQGDGAQLSDKALKQLVGIHGQIDEIALLEDVVQAQAQRIKEQVAMENIVISPFTRIRQEMRVMTEMIDKLLEWKVELGYPGYRRVPHRVDLTGRLQVSRVDMLTLEERKKLLEFGELVKGLIEMSKTPEGAYEMSEEDRGKGGERSQ